MKAMGTKMKALRTQFHLSEDYVARYLGIDRSSLALLEDGRYNATSDMIAKLSLLFGVSPDVLLHKTGEPEKIPMLARSSDVTDERDESEVKNLLRIRNQIRTRARTQV